MKFLLSLCPFIAVFLISAQAQEPAVKPEVPSSVDMPDPVTRIKKLEGNNFALDDIRFNSETGEIRFPARVNMVKDQIEYIIVTDKGKTHESLLSTKTSPFILNTVMLLCRYQPSAEGLITFVEREGPGGGETPPEKEEKEPEAEGTNPFSKEEPGEDSSATSPPPAVTEKKPVNNLLEITVRYEKEGKEVDVLLDDWIYNTATKKSLEDKYWVYTGSDIQRGEFVAELEGSITAIYVDRFAMLNNPIKGNDNDDIWEPFTAQMPPVDTRLEVILRPYKADAGE